MNTSGLLAERELSPEEERLVAAYKAEINLNDSFSRIGYGHSQGCVDDLTKVMTQSPVTALAKKIAEVVVKLKAANPAVLEEKKSWIGRKTGADTEAKVLYFVSRKSIDALLAEASRIALHVKDLVVQIDDVLCQHKAETSELELRLIAGQRFMAEMPEANTDPVQGFVIDNPRERYARRLTNMSALLNSSHLSERQILLVRSQALDMLERFHEIEAVLIPIWRQHSLNLASAHNLSATDMTQAVRSHEVLLTHLSSLQGNSK